jgi:molybdopterin-containing oxidoreductase family iron-sulfur binding subunit
MADRPIDLGTLRQRLRLEKGPRFWRSLEELADTESFRQWLRQEFPPGASGEPDDPSRRRFLQLMAASFALAGISACTRQPREAIVPYVQQPEQILPGKPLYYATATLLGGFATGVLVETHEGRPTKVEGNPEHPASLGASDAFMQASVLELYDPDRSQVVLEKGAIRPWSSFVAAVGTALRAQAAKQGAGLRILTERVTSPTLAAQIHRVLEKYPQAKWYAYEPAAPDAARLGARLAFGEEVAVRWEVSRADAILSLDADFLAEGPGHLRYAREFASRRRPRGEDPGMNRLYVVEGSPSITGAAADHRLRVRSSEVEDIARRLASRLGLSVPERSRLGEAVERWIEAVAKDLERRPGRSLVLAGDRQPPIVHAIAHAINERLGNVGATVIYTEPIEVSPGPAATAIAELAEEMEKGAAELLLILGGNPVYDAPADLEFGRRLEKVRLSVRLGLYEDETSALCHWHLPLAHPFETWGDARAYDGTATILQPLIAPLYDGRSPLEVLSIVLGEPERTAHDIVRDTWKRERPEGDFEAFWRRALHDGLVRGSAAAPRTVRLRDDWASAPGSPPGEGLEIVFRTDPTVYDGRFGNNGWLQELPKPLTKLTWDNAAELSPATALRLGVRTEDVVEIVLGSRRIEAPVWVEPGHADDSVTLALGYGRTRAGRVGSGAGFDAYRLRTVETPWIALGAVVRPTGRRLRLATTQEHHSMEGRHLVRSASLDRYREHPDFAQHLEHAPPPDLTLFEPWPYPGHAWGMAIDLGACIGCGACVVACQAENNIAVVGKDQVARGREMHWIRIDRYYEGDPQDPETVHQPVLCMHCENAPCEVVCPVGATVHSDEGLNDMVYNRCVGTRYCANNCPYKVRRFNWYLYSDWRTPSLKLVRNPDVTVRSRGVMEKCTYCVQRIQRARIDARREGRPIRDGEILTACQQACPTEAIVFGDTNDPESRVAKRKADPRNYALLGELNTRPRTTYLARIRNPNPDLERPGAREA